MRGQAKASLGGGGLEFKVTGGPGDWATKAGVSGKILGLNIVNDSMTLADKNGFLHDGKWDWACRRSPRRTGPRPCKVASNPSFRKAWAKESKSRPD